MAVYEAASAGVLDLSSKISRTALGKTIYPSLMDTLDDDHTLTLAELCRFTLATSDNLGADYLLREIGVDYVNSYLSNLGCNQTLFSIGFGDSELRLLRNNNLTTVSDMLKILEFLYEKHPQGSEILRSLSNGIYKGRIGLRLPEDLSIANKTGSLDGVVNDVGVISDENCAVALVFLSASQVDNASTAVAIGDLTSLIWSELGGRLIERGTSPKATAL